MSYFSSSRSERDAKIAKPAPGEPRLMETAAPARVGSDVVSTIGPGMLITGNIVCAGSLQVHGRVVGDIHASQLVVGDEAKVEGKIIAPETIIRGKFHGTVHSNSVKLQNTAVVEGEIFNKSLSIEEKALFEGVSRRLEKPVEAPSNAHAAGDKPALRPHVVALTEAMIKA